MAELGNLVAWYSPPSAANVNCENPRRKPVSHLLGPNWAFPSGFWPQPGRFSYAVHNPRASFTGCTQAASLSGLRETLIPVQSQNRGIQFSWNVSGD